MLRSLRVLGIAIGTVLIGPIIFAAMAALVPTTEDEGQASEALQLLRKFDDAFPQGIPRYSIDPDYYFRQCGYDGNTVLGDISSVKQEGGWVPYHGYYDLSSWFRGDFRREVEEARSNQLNTNLSGFELRFLNRCIANSAFSKVCGFRVRKVLEAGELYSNYSLPSSSPRPDESGQIRTMCAFLDGIAARKGQKLSTQQIDAE